MYSADGQQAAAMKLPEPVKNIYYGRNAQQVPITKSNAFCADMYDPKCRDFILAWIPGNVPYDPLWCPVVQCDDGDFVYGLASGATGHPNETGITPQQNQWGPHLAFVILCAPDPMPANGTSPRNGTAITYTDRKNYSKHALKDFLIKRYQTLAAFNNAWGSTYTTFESDGAWGVGNGLLDENGRHTAWLIGATNVRWCDSTVWKPVIKKDLDDFLEQITDKYAGMCREGINKKGPDILYKGPSNIGGWQGPARAPVLRGYRKHLDMLSCQINYSLTQKAIDFMTEHIGPDMPIVSWTGFPPASNADSCLYYLANNYDAGHQGQPNKAQKWGDIHVQALQIRSNATKQIPYIGFENWAHYDDAAERVAWGALASIRGNIYNGGDWTTVKADPFDASYNVIPDDKVFGDCLTGYKAAMQRMGDIVTQGLDPDPAETGTVAGLVTDDKAAPLASASITAGDVSTLSGADGRYTLAGVAVGPQSLTASKSGYVTTTRTVTVKQDQTITADVSLTATAGGLMFNVGDRVKTDSTPHNSRAIPDGTAPPQTPQIPGNSTGVVVEPGEVPDQGRPGSTQTNTLWDNPALPRPPAYMTSTNMAKVTTPPSTGTVSGTVTGEAADLRGHVLNRDRGPGHYAYTRSAVPLQGAEVKIDDAHKTVADANGNYSLGNLAPGSYTVTATAPGHDSSSKPASVAAGQTVDVDFALPATVVPSNDLEERVAALEDWRAQIKDVS